jgi:hypothetical protein
VRGSSRSETRRTIPTPAVVTQRSYALRAHLSSDQVAEVTRLPAELW